MRVLQYPDPTLGKVAIKVENVPQLLTDDLLAEMQRTMVEENGCGLAAPQVGISSAFFILSPTISPLHQVFVNPRLEFPPEAKRVSGLEGCLSFKGIQEIKVSRFDLVWLEAQDASGEFFKLQADGFLAIAIQHEYDHLQGTTLFDRASPRQKRNIQTKFGLRRPLTRKKTWV